MPGEQPKLATHHTTSTLHHSSSSPSSSLEDSSKTIYTTSKLKLSRLIGKLHKSQLVRQLIAEAAGTFLIVWFGTGAVMSAVFTNSMTGNLVSIAAVWSIGVTMAIACTSSISGAHLNPAITVSMALFRTNTFEWTKVLPYTVAQLIGAILASVTNYGLYATVIRQYEAANNIVRSSATTTAIGSAKAFGEYYVAPVTTWQAFCVEAVGTAILAGVIFAVTHPESDVQKQKVYVAPLIGVTVGALISVLAPLTQAGFNPARDFGPRLVAYASGWTGVAFHQAWLYIVAPLVGAPVGAALVEKILFAKPKEEEDTDDDDGAV